ncbi:MAG TPA: IS630 family transposase [Spirochaetota bacterium]|nr:IS630 family transposase [Spirochaetota bacterium]
MKNEDARTFSQDAQELLRKKAVKMIIRGEKRKEIAELLGVSTEALRKWFFAYKNKGITGLKKRKRGRRPGGKLNNKEVAIICKMIRDKDPDQLKLPFYLWTAEAVRDLIHRKYNVYYGIRQIQRYLKQWGFTPQKPKRVAYEQNSEEVKKWLTEIYPSIAKAAKREKARIYWGDEMGLRSDYQAGRSYAVKGQTPVINGTGKRFGCNMISAITNRGDIAFMIFKKKFTSRMFIRFLRGLVAGNKKTKIFLIIDSHPVHRSKVVMKWVEDNKKLIRVFFLPGYSPDLNPDEFLNHDVKANAVGRKRPGTQKKMMGNVRNHLNRCKRKPDRVKKFFNAKSVRYAA